MIIRKPIIDRGFILMPRQSGKTTMAVNIFLQNPTKNLLVVESQNMKYRVINKFKINRIYHKNIITSGINMRGNIIEGSLIMDDLHFFERNLDRFIGDLIPSLKNPNQILTTSTHIQLYEIINRHINIPFFDKTLIRKVGC